MRILNFLAENFKGITVVDITPVDDMVVISGANHQGKSSVLDAISAALEGASHIQSEPIRRGQKRARIRLDLGDAVVTRTFTRGEEGTSHTTSVKVEAAEGYRAGQPQKWLDSMIDALALDPVAFIRAKPEQQFKMVERLIPNVDSAAIAKANKADYDKRTDINRSAKEARAAAEQIAVPSELPDDYVDEAALTEDLAQAGEHNAKIERRLAARQNAREKIERAEAHIVFLRDATSGHRATIERRRADNIADLQRQIEALQHRVNVVNQKTDEELTTLNDDVNEQCDHLALETDVLRARLADAWVLPEPIDVAAIKTRMADARNLNDGIRRRTERDRHAERAASLEKQSAALTEAIEARSKARDEAIAAAKLPVDGLGLGFDPKGDPIVTFNEVPFDQASSAEQLRTSVAMAMVNSPTLRVIRVRDGSLLDDTQMGMIAQMAKERDFQVWVERVDTTGTVGFVLKDGHLNKPIPSEDPENGIF